MRLENKKNDTHIRRPEHLFIYIYIYISDEEKNIDMVSLKNPE
jgi:hypothetical protein